MTGQKRNQENPMPAIDEGWWSSVLAEESRSAAHEPVHSVGVSRAEENEIAKTAVSEKKPATNWIQVKDLYLRDQIIDLSVTGHNRGGLLVEGDGLYGFVPFSHLIDLAGKAENIDRDHDLESYVGRSLRLKVIECVPEDGRVVFSERAAQSESGKRAELFHALQPGQHVKGVITNITDFGVFVDLGGVEGLIHISELSWGRVSHPTQIVKMGQTIDVQVLELAPERCRVALSLKRLLSNPWQNAAADFPEGCIKSAVITSVLSYGAFARLDAGVEGLIHASEIPQTDGKPLKETLSEGQAVQVRILHLDAAHQRMGLSMRLE
ncbi:S1 RNA-binding domain-containing protein [Candidatus Villigracilis saccharophilus]|jgi:small subunit ribosomal protein S1|uniref:30S ribosomal protein S1 n=1 Tax=Candidatus Villigracilis saccharophilus TaxID=3140684 RepID=UPI0031355134|nr:30S ribosomal protein S1 [Anaerolineales bacterium]